MLITLIHNTYLTEADVTVLYSFTLTCFMAAQTIVLLLLKMIVMIQQGCSSSDRRQLFQNLIEVIQKPVLVP